LSSSSYSSLSSSSSSSFSLYSWSYFSSFSCSCCCSSSPSNSSGLLSKSCNPNTPSILIISRRWHLINLVGDISFHLIWLNATPRFGLYYIHQAHLPMWMLDMRHNKLVLYYLPEWIYQMVGILNSFQVQQYYTWDSLLYFF